MMTYQLTALGVVLVLYFFSISWRLRWTEFKMNIASEVLLAIDAYVSQAGYARKERRRFERGWIRNSQLRADLAKRIVE